MCRTIDRRLNEYWLLYPRRPRQHYTVWTTTQRCAGWSGGKA